MATYLIIAGHGPQRNGTFDPGATGFITKGEHRLFRDDYFPMMKKYVTKNDTFIFYHERKVSNWGNLVQLVRQYSVDEVIELHFDAFTSNARGGHVIIHSDYAPDDMDLRLRDAIEEMVGVRYTHRGHRGISGRSNLYNVNLARNNGITYRLLELGFGTNRTDANIMTQQVDKYSRLLMEAITGAKVEASKPALTPSKRLGDSYTVEPGDTLSAIANKYNTTVEALVKHNELSNPNLIRVGEDIEIPIAVVAPKPKPVVHKSIDQLAQEVIDGKHGVGDARRESLGNQFSAVQAKVNELLAPKPKKTIEQLAREVIDGKHGTGDARKRSLGNQYDAVQRRVNEILKPNRKSNAQIAREVIDGKWGNNPQRRQRLESAGYNYAAVQAEVNKLVR